jgi:hypothetical protein
METCCLALMVTLDSMTLGLGVPPLPLWAHGEPAAMPALFFFLSGAAAPIRLGPPILTM